MNKFSTQPLRGFSDFYPEEMRVDKWILGKIREVVEGYGYEEWNGPTLESIDIFAAKSSEELVTEQAFIVEKVKGEKLILRPELTPSLARMVAAKIKELELPLRWYVFPNCFRYERPQRGRRREFIQVNVDILSHDGLYADLEIFNIIVDIMKSFGVTGKQFQIRWNNRRFLDELLLMVAKVPEGLKNQVYKMIDKRDKMEPAEYEKWVRDTLRDDAAADRVLQIGSFHDINVLPFDNLPHEFFEYPGVKEVQQLTEMIKKAGLKPYCTFSPEIVRGLDYYTGTVYEVFDTGTENRRALFGGGRYDNLIDLFSDVQLPGTGFGLGIYVLELFLTTYNKIPPEVKLPDRSHGVYIAPLDASCLLLAIKVAQLLRAQGKQALVGYDCRKLGRQIETASKRGFPYVIIIGKKEVDAQSVTLKNLQNGEQQTVPIAEMGKILVSKT
ncbi:MAG: histidyl-tRNA synthetase [Promethearchaeota archaeon CR_4]|nr:MAG: histidyl-tRNA synthetase [Candidatus Lokiarchaeota archaeon CR_4]